MGQHQAAVRKNRLTVSQTSKLTETHKFVRSRINKLYVMTFKVSEAKAQCHKQYIIRSRRRN